MVTSTGGGRDLMCNGALPKREKTNPSWYTLNVVADDEVAWPENVDSEQGLLTGNLAASRMIYQLHLWPRDLDPVAVVKFRLQCEEFASLLQDVVKAVTEIQTKPQGISGRFKELIRVGTTTDKISGYQRKISELRSNFIVR
ncbi:hypothetical protein B0H14DRAFT_3506788 [Mycena olivaceomarginata]|nr:hypothetical protein B0H14DRAFT_3506788 [Mycena olivaceomarginata]